MATGSTSPPNRGQDAASAFGSAAPSPPRLRRLVLLDLILGLVGVLGCQGAGDVLEVRAFGLDTEEDLGDPSQSHDPCAYAECHRDQRPVTRLDHVAEEQRPCDATDGGADRVEEGDRQGPGFHREYLTDGEVRGAGAGGGEEEADDENDEEDPGVADVRVEDEREDHCNDR